MLLAGFLDVMLRAWAFIGLALAVGGVAFRYIVLRNAGADAAGDRMLRRCAAVVAGGALCAAICQVLAPIVVLWGLSDESGEWPIRAFLSTGFARAAIVHGAAALFFGFAALYVRSRPRSRTGWVVAVVFALVTMATGAPLTHGASRTLHPALLMTITVLHQLPAVVWVGGTAHLVAQWRLLRRGPGGGEVLWPRMVARFSPVAMVCVLALLGAGIYLAREYIYGLQGLVGTAYGTMLLTKIVLMAAALCLGGLNFLAARQWRTTGQSRALLARVPVLVEAEAAIGICILMAAAAFTGQPPAVDVQPEWATPGEVAWVFAPKKPQLTMPPYKEMVAQSTLTLDPYSLPTPLEKIQSDFNHNVSGAFVLLAGLGAVLYRIGGVRWARHWPLAFSLVGVFILIVGEPTVWPMGPEGFWSTLRAPEVLVHRLAVVMAMGLALCEWRVSVGGLGKTGARYVFPVICFVGGALLLAHSHSIFVTKWAFLIEVSHNALGILAVLAGATRWMELRLPEREGRFAGVVWPVCLALVGAVLFFYRET